MPIKLETFGIDKLTVAEKLELIDQIWDSLPVEVAPEEVPEWHLAIINESIAEIEANPNLGRPFREVMAEYGIVE